MLFLHYYILKFAIVYHGLLFLLMFSVFEDVFSADTEIEQNVD